MSPELVALHWTAALDQLEADLESEDGGSWVPPVVAGALPTQLRERAMRLLDAQLNRIAALEQRRRSLAEQRDALRRVPRAAGAETPRYLDLQG